MNRFPLRGAVMLLILSCFTACSSFDQHWNRAAKGAGGATCWDGKWISEKHHKSDGSPEDGRLRCVLEPAAGQALTARFHANWLIFSSNFTTTLKPVPSGPRRETSRHFSGTQHLPSIFGGDYQYDARIAGDHFVALYTSSYDHGTFKLRRASSADHPESHPQH
jgi:hypothetical protein